jgi:hypothetical protein
MATPVTVTDGKITLGDSNIMQPVDIQSHVQTTIQTHNAVSVGASGSSIDTQWRDANGYDQLSLTYTSDASHSNNMTVYWSNDGTNIHGSETPISTGSRNNAATTIPTRARYFKTSLFNGDTVAHTMSAWAMLKA